MKIPELILTNEQKAHLARLPKSMADTVFEIWVRESLQKPGLNPWGREAKIAASKTSAYDALQSEGYDEADMDTPDAMERD